MCPSDPGIWREAGSVVVVIQARLRSNALAILLDCLELRAPRSSR
jgi:hypothetical protein